MNKKAIFPNILTVGNLFCGFFAIASIMNNNYIQGAWLIVIGTFLDTIDGWVARLTKGTSQFGIEFDSLADLVASGLAPALLVYKLGLMSTGFPAVLICFIPVFSGAFRLARYNVQTKRKYQGGFVGMPIPMFALMIASYVIFSDDIWGEIKIQQSLIPLTIVLSALMVSTIPYKKIPNISFNDVKRKNLLFWLYLICITALVLDIRKTGFPMVFIMFLWGTSSGIISYFRHEEEDDELADISL